ncbi:ATP-binding protein [Piscibacillus sp. B03]|uniref:ATP-binding protein n=1 Tax=Piscibacillus sp. B03 TaxID=3457430 RepID=UPI003FCC3B2F
MQNTQDGLKQVMKNIGLGRIRQIGTRICEECQSEVPIMERTQQDGQTLKTSVCLTCDNNKLRKRLPKLEMDPESGEAKVPKGNKAKGFSLKYEKVPDKLKGKTLNDLKWENESEKQLREICAQYILNFGQLDYHSLVLYGPMGVGKSHAAYAISKALKDRGYTTMFMMSDDYLSLIKSTYDNPDLSEQSIYDMIAELDLLVLDDIGAEYNNQKGKFESWASEKIFKLVELREDKPTVFTTNYQAGDFEDKYGHVQGGRIISRMMAGAKRIEIDGRDRREGDY